MSLANKYSSVKKFSPVYILFLSTLDNKTVWLNLGCML